MTDHDPMCPWNPPVTTIACQCALIASVRADERERNTPLDVAAFREKLHADLRAKVDQAFADSPPYLFPEAKEVLLPGFRNTTIHEAIEEVWRVAHENVLALFPEEKP